MTPTTHGEWTDLERWEAAYARFETPQEETAKFARRLKKLKATDWARGALIVELFCGRENGLHALSGLGFTNLEGADLSPSLIAQYKGPARCHTVDCRHLPFENGSKDILIVQGGLHHLLSLPEDLERTLKESNRVLRDGGRFVAVEPWRTPFLRLVHFLSERRLARRCSAKLDAFATMVEHERQTYEQWLSRPDIILSLLRTYFDPELCSIQWGKLSFVGRKKASGR